MSLKTTFFRLGLLGIMISLLSLCTFHNDRSVPSTSTLSPTVVGDKTSSPIVKPPTVTTIIPTTMPSHTPKPTNTPVSTETKTPTPTFSPLERLTAEIIKIKSMTPEPTIPLPTAQHLYKNYIEHNPNCIFPCWWDIIPGKSTWGEVETRLTKVSTSINKYVIDESSFNANITVIFPKEMIVEPLWFILTVKNDIVQSIFIDSSLLKIYKIPNRLTELGPPSEIKILTFRDNSREGRPFYLRLFYKDQGIILNYEVFPARLINNKIRACFDQNPANKIVLWGKDKALTFEEGIQLYPTEFVDFKFLSLAESTGMDINTFYNRYKNLREGICIDTPVNLWSGQYQ